MLRVVEHLAALYRVADALGMQRCEQGVRASMPALVYVLDELNFAFELEKPLLHNPMVIAYHSKIAGFAGVVQVRLKGDHFTVSIQL